MPRLGAPALLRVGDTPWGKEQSGDFRVHLQRRRQKLPENTPLPSLTPSVKWPEWGLGLEEGQIHWAVRSPGGGGLCGRGVGPVKEGLTPTDTYPRPPLPSGVTWPQDQPLP